jgi:Ca-activated chloride channel homolog
MVGLARNVVLFSVLFLLSLASAQELQEQVEVQLVQVDLTATDSKGAVVTDLTKDDFTLKEDGKQQTISHFYNSSDDQNRYPLTISFLVDTSYSMREMVAGMTRIQIAVKAAEMVITQLKPEDQVELIEFNEKPEAVVPFTSNLDSVREKFESLTFHEAGTAMHDAMLFAEKRIHDRSGRKIIVIFSDGMDSSSKAIYEDVVDAIRKSDATIVTFFSDVSHFDYGMTDPNSIGRVKAQAGEDALQEYADISGGQFFSFHKEPELVKAMEGFRQFVQSQYTLAYTPAVAKKAAFRKIKIDCRRKGVKLRYRQGYWAG